MDRRAERPASPRGAGWGLQRKERSSDQGLAWVVLTSHSQSQPYLCPSQPPACPHQREGVVGLYQLLRAVLLQHHYALEARAAAPGTGLTVHQVCVAAAVLAGHKQDVEDLHLEQEESSSMEQEGCCGHLLGVGAITSTYVALVAVVSRLVLHPALVGNFLASPHQTLSLHLAVLHGLQEAESVAHRTGGEAAGSTKEQEPSCPELPHFIRISPTSTEWHLS